MEIIKTKNGERYKEKVRLDTGKLITKTFRRKTDALAWKRKVETEKARGLLGGHSIRSATFDEVAIKWFESKVEHSLAYKTVLTYRYELHSNLIPHFAGCEMSKISLSQIEELRSKLQRKGLSPKTINRSLTVTRQVFMYAQDEGHLNELPFKRSLLLKLKKRMFVYFEDSEIKALLRENRNNETYPILYLAIHTGMRLGEILGLCWDRVNFSSGNIEITRTLHGKGVLQEMTKSGKARYFPINEELRSFFMALRRSQKSPVFVFTRKDGSAFDPPHFSCRKFKQACIDARVRCLRFHDLRHSFASHFMMNGGNVFDLKELLGHSDMNTTMIYAHLSPGHLREASRIVNFGEFSSDLKSAGPLLALANKNG